MSGPAEHPPLDAEQVLAVLESHRVSYVVIGGYAAELHGSTRKTVDIDVVPETSSENLTRLTTALTALGARIRTDTDPDGLPFATSAATLAGTKMLNLVTVHGELDLTFTPSGTTGYDDLSRASTVMPLGRLQVRVAALADVIRSKTAANRAKDRAALPELHALAATTAPPQTPARTTLSARDLAAASFPDPPETAPPQQSAAERIQAARRDAAASRANRRPPHDPER